MIPKYLTCDERETPYAWPFSLKNNKYQCALNYNKYKEKLGDTCIVFAIVDRVYDGFFIEQNVFYKKKKKKCFK